MIEAPGFYPDLTEVEHFADPCPTPSLRQSGAKVLLGKSPHHLAFEHPRLNPYRKANRQTTKFMRHGSAVHSLALGRGKEVSVIRHPNFRTSSAKRAAEMAIAAGRIPVLEHEHDTATAAAAVVRRAIDEELEGAEWFPEMCFYWIEETAFGPVWCGGMLDIFCPARRRILDLKNSSIPLTWEAIGRDMASNGYDFQREFYKRGASALAATAGEFEFGTLYVENDAPFGYTTVDLDTESDQYAAGDVELAIRTFGQCLHSRTWPSYPRRTRTSTPGYHHQAAKTRQLSQEL